MNRFLSFAVGLLSVLLSLEAHAATLIWDSQPTSGGSLMIERGTSPTGPFITVATLPQGTLQFILTPGAWGHYRVSNSVGPSNTVEYAASIYTGFLEDRVSELEAKVTALETASGPAPVVTEPPSSNFSTRVIDLDHIEITGTGCSSMATTGSGTRRVIECRH